MIIDPEAQQTVQITVVNTFKENIAFGKSVERREENSIIKYMIQSEIDELLISLRPDSEA